MPILRGPVDASRQPRHGQVGSRGEAFAGGRNERVPGMKTAPEPRCEVSEGWGEWREQRKPQAFAGYNTEAGEGTAEEPEELPKLGGFRGSVGGKQHHKNRARRGVPEGDVSAWI